VTRPETYLAIAAFLAGVAATLCVVYTFGFYEALLRVVCGAL